MRFSVSQKKLGGRFPVLFWERWISDILTMSGSRSIFEGQGQSRILM